MDRQHAMFLRGKRIYLRPVEKEDIRKVYVWMNDLSGVLQFLSSPYPNFLEDEEAWYEKIVKNKKTDIVFAIVIAETHEMIGVMGLHQIDYINGTAMTGSFIGEEKHRSQGYATEAKKLLLHYTFNYLNLHKVWSHVFSNNPRSMRALEKCGYVLEGILRKHKKRGGTFLDVHTFAVFADDFKQV